VVLGAAVGFGFAALESAGYAFTALFGSNGLSLLNVVETELLRGILTPFGHGLWTAILGGALFATAARSRHGGPRLHASLVGWYLVTAVLHGLWDASSSIAFWVTLLLTGTPMQWTLIGQGEAPPVTPEQVHLYTAANWGLLLLDALVGLVILVVRWRRAAAIRRTPIPSSGAAPVSPVPGPPGPPLPAARG
jgi:hypothetical protein